MKVSIILLVANLFISFDSGPTVDTYDWGPYEKASAYMLESQSKVVQAHVILFDNYDVDFSALPKRTKTQLVTLQQTAFIEWRVAEEALGTDEAAKYWSMGSVDEKSNLTCYDEWEIEYSKLMPIIYNKIKFCNLETKTACHLDGLSMLMDLDKTFNNCLLERHGATLFTFTKDLSLPIESKE